MIIALGESAYVALSKGQINEEGHLILVPVGHCASYKGLEVGGEVRTELDKTQGIVRKVFAERGLGMVAFQMSDGGGSDHHFIIQMVAVPLETDGGEGVSAFVKERADEAGLVVVEEGLEGVNEGDAYFVLGDGTGDDLVLVPGPDGARVSPRFGSMAIADYLGKPDRSNWKKVRWEGLISG